MFKIFATALCLFSFEALANNDVYRAVRATGVTEQSQVVQLRDVSCHSIAGSLARWNSCSFSDAADDSQHLRTIFGVPALHLYQMLGSEEEDVSVATLTLHNNRSITGSAKGTCDTLDQQLQTLARIDAQRQMPALWRWMGEWTDTVTVIGFPDCLYKMATAENRAGPIF